MSAQLHPVCVDCAVRTHRGEEVVRRPLLSVTCALCNQVYLGTFLPLKIQEHSAWYKAWRRWRDSVTTTHETERVARAAFAAGWAAGAQHWKRSSG